MGTHAWRASGPRDLARLIRHARRHSGYVRALRVGVPAAAFAGLGLVVLLTWFNPLRTMPNLPVSVGNLVVSGTKITMEAPKVAGYTRDNRAYNLTAEAAAQDITNPTVLELSGIRAKMEMQNNATVDMTAVAGIYDTKAELLTLSQYIVLISSDGYEGHLTEAKADIRKGNVTSEKPVEILMRNGKVVANRMDVVDSGALMRFDAGVVVDLISPPSASADRKAQRPPGAFQGFSANRDKPVRVTSNSLEVRDKEKNARFLGNVRVTQGDTTVKSNTLDVFYEQDDSAGGKASPSGSTDQQQIRRMEAKGSVVVTQKDQTATGDTAIFDTRANIVTLVGNVVVTQGAQIIKGERLTSDLTTGVSQVEGKVSGVMFPKTQKPGDAKTGEARGAQPASAAATPVAGFSINRDKPVQITSNTLEVRDKEKKAIFVGNVLVAQGEATMKSKTLDVYYDQDDDGSSDQQVRRLEAKGGVVVAQKDQTATGETGVFDVRSNTVTLIGDVVSTQGPQVVKGDRLTVDLTTGASRVEGKVKSLLLPNSRPKTSNRSGDKAADGNSDDAKAGDGKAADRAADGREARTETGRGKETAKPAAKSGQPLRLN